LWAFVKLFVMFVLGEDILIEHLHPTTAYVFQIRAVNEVGVGLQRRITVTTDDVRKLSASVTVSVKIIM